MLPLYLAKQTLILVSVLHVCFNEVNGPQSDLKVTKIIKLNTCDYLSEITLFDTSTIILNNTFKTTMPLINAIIVNKTLGQFFPLSGYHSTE